MAYSKAANQSAMKYTKEKQKSILLKIKKDDFETIIEPAIKKSGLPTVTYIKQAIYEKVEREKNM